jgi:hypothetical protein
MIFLKLDKSVLSICTTSGDLYHLLRTRTVLERWHTYSITEYTVAKLAKELRPV